MQPPRGSLCQSLASHVAKCHNVKSYTKYSHRVRHVAAGQRCYSWAGCVQDIERNSSRFEFCCCPACRSNIPSADSLVAVQIVAAFRIALAKRVTCSTRANIHSTPRITNTTAAENNDWQAVCIVVLSAHLFLQTLRDPVDITFSRPHFGSEALDRRASVGPLRLAAPYMNNTPD